MGIEVSKMKPKNKYNRLGAALAPVVLMGVSTLLGVLSYTRITAINTPLEIPADTPGLSLLDVNDIQLANSRKQASELVDALMANNRFAARQQEPQLIQVVNEPVQIPKITGILGTEVLINGRWYGKNAKPSRGITILEVNPYSVTLEVEGRDGLVIVKPVLADVIRQSQQYSNGYNRPTVISSTNSMGFNGGFGQMPDFGQMSGFNQMPGFGQRGSGYGQDIERVRQEALEARAIAEQAQ
jgi:hypothetical protein